MLNHLIHIQILLDANILQNLDNAKYLNEINIIIGQIILNPPTCQNIQVGEFHEML